MTKGTITIKTRGFEVVKGFEDKGINLPTRATKHAAGYDFEAAEEVEIQPISGVMDNIRRAVNDIILPATFFEHGGFKNTSEFEEWVSKVEQELVSKKLIDKLKPTMVPTGIKAYMQDDEFLAMYNRSGNPIKQFLVLTNGVGVVDSDYYSNSGNDGHIMFQFINFGYKPVVIKKGDRIGQGVFQKYLLADEDVSGGERIGGHGSTGFK